MLGRNEALHYNINGNDIKTNSTLSHNLNGKVSNTSVIRDIITIIKREECTQNLRQMHSENFFDHEIRTLTAKLLLQEVLGRNEALHYNINGNDIKIDSTLSHNLNGKAPNTHVIGDIITIIKKGRMNLNLKMNAL